MAEYTFKSFGGKRMKAKYKKRLYVLMLFIMIFIESCDNSVTGNNMKEEQEYSVSVVDFLQNYVKVDKKSAKKEEKVTITLSVYDNKVVDSLNIHTEEGVSVPYSVNNSDSSYSFIMPQSNVTIYGLLRDLEQAYKLDSSNFRISGIPDVYYLNDIFRLDDIQIYIYDNLGNYITTLTTENTLFTYDSPDLTSIGEKTVIISFSYEEEEYSINYIITVMETFIPDDIKYTYDEDSGTLTVYADFYPARIPDYYSSSGGVMPPWEKHKNDVKKIIIAEGITEVGNQAFYYYKNFTELELPDSLEKIGYMAFCGCESLPSVELPEKLKVIEGFAFSGALFASLKLPELLEEIGTISGLTKLEVLEIPSSVKKWITNLANLNHLKSLYCLIQ